MDRLFLFQNEILKMIFNLVFKKILAVIPSTRLRGEGWGEGLKKVPGYFFRIKFAKANLALS